MLEVTNIEVSSFDLDHLDLSWEIETTSEDPQDYDFYVLRAGSPLGPYTALAGPLVDIYIYRDVQVGLLHQWRNLYYRIRLVHRQTGETLEFPEDDGASLSARPPLDVLDIRRQEYILFKEHIGRTCWLFKRRTFGMRCPNCHIEYMDRRSRSNCPTCYDTSYVGGYHYPIECLVQIDPSPKSDQLTSLEKTEVINTTGRSLAFPPVDPTDIIVESDNRRWRVRVSSPTERLRAVGHQELQLHAVIPGDVEYTLPVDVDLDDVSVSPPREFVNPQTPGHVWDGHLGTLADIFQVGEE